MTPRLNQYSVITGQHSSRHISLDLRALPHKWFSNFNFVFHINRLLDCPQLQSSPFIIQSTPNLPISQISRKSPSNVTYFFSYAVHKQTDKHSDGGNQCIIYSTCKCDKNRRQHVISYSVVNGQSHRSS